MLLGNDEQLIVNTDQRWNLEFYVILYKIWRKRLAKEFL